MIVIRKNISTNLKKPAGINNTIFYFHFVLFLEDLIILDFVKQNNADISGILKYR